MNPITMAVVILAMSTLVWGASPIDKSSSTAPGTNPSTTTILGSTAISPGRYVMTVMPVINARMASRIEDSLNSMPGLSKAKARMDDSSIHFTVNPGAVVKASDIQKTVAQTYAGVALSEPVLEGSTTPHPGF